MPGWPTKNSYVVELGESVFLEDDPSKACRNYPNPEYTSYRECDDQFMKDFVATFDPPGIVPVWLTDDITQVTEQTVINSYGETLNTIMGFRSRELIQDFLRRPLGRDPALPMPPPLLHRPH